MRTNRWTLAVAVLVVLVAVTACQPAAAPVANDTLAQVMARGTLVIATDPAYPPQSELVADAARAEGTKCAEDQKTANQFTGFDIDSAVAIAEAMGVEPCFVTPDWTIITGGNWAGRWDLSVGSMTVTPERMGVLFFAQPYYTTPAVFFVHTDSAAASIADLAGKTVGVCAGCTYESYLDGSLEIPGETIDFQLSDATIQGYDTDTSALQDLALGDGTRLDAVLTALPTGQAFVDEGQPVKQLGDAVFFEYLAPAIDKEATADQAAFLAKLNEVLKTLHSSGKLKALSEQYFGLDLTAAAASFDASALGQ
jgi:polar amino acid transport system substrate-binding protein